MSHAGKRAGLRPGTRSGLWEHMAYAIDQLRPRLVLIENVRGLLSADAHSDMERDCWCVGDERESALRALGAVLGDLADLGYDAEWVSVRASDVGAPHGRFRVFIVAHPAGEGLEGLEQSTGPAWGRHGAAAVALLGTPTAHERTHSPRKVHHGMQLANQVASLLPTPKASDGPNGGPGMRNGRGEADALPGVVALLPTPRAQNGEGRNNTIWERPADQPQNLENALAHAGRYAPALARWATILGRPTPPITDDGRLSARFVEWMMGLPDGWVTDPAIGLSRAQALKVLGNGVVPQQAALALRMLLWSGTLPTLPTPIVVDRGERCTPDEWDAWTESMRARHSNGNGHGRSLAIEAVRPRCPMSAWRCCCCPATGDDPDPEHALRDHWARDCPGTRGEE